MNGWGRCKEGKSRTHLERDIDLVSQSQMNTPSVNPVNHTLLTLGLAGPPVKGIPFDLNDVVRGLTNREG